MKLQKGDCALLRTCPEDSACYFIGTIEKIPTRFPHIHAGQINIFSTNCLPKHITGKTVRFFYQEDIEEGKVAVWL